MGWKILIVDDDEPLLETLENHILSLGDFEVDTAPNCQLALKKILKTKYDLLITDLFIGKDNGYQLLELIEKTRIKFPIIVMTGFFKESLDFVSEVDISSQIVQIIEKPFELLPFTNAIFKALK